MSLRCVCLCFGWVLVSCRLFAGESVLFDMDTIRHQPGEVAQGEKKTPIGTVELVDGKFNKAVRFSFGSDLGPGFMTASVHGNPEWDRAAGFSFYVKGDGSTNFAGLEWIDRDDYSLRYGFCFSIESTEWHKVVVRWRDLIPELSAPLVDAHSGYSPSKFGNLWVGKWFYWHDYPAHSFVVDQVSLERELPPDPEPAFQPGLQRLKSRLAAHQAVTIVTMGDSLTDKRHWANRDVLWAELLAARIKEQFGSAVNLVNPAIGGTTLSQNLVLMPRWLRQVPHPDLVTVWFGSNDWDSGVRGQRFREYLEMGVDRIRRMTGGKADILLMTPGPGFKRYETMAELEASVREAAQAKNAGFVDIASEFRKAGDAETALKKGYWAWDNVHLGTNGHKLTAEAVLQAVSPTAR